MVNAPMKMANPVRIIPKDGVYLETLCPWQQNTCSVSAILKQYWNYINHFLVTPDKKNFTNIVQQWLAILWKVKQTEVCFDYRWAKLQVKLDMSKAIIDIERTTILFVWCETLNEYYSFIWSWYTWDIHLPNWILRAKVETKWSWEFLFIFPGIPYWFYEECDRAKRLSLRGELNSIYVAHAFFAELAKIRRIESESQKKSWRVPPNKYSIADIKWDVKWIIANISNNWIWFYVPNGFASQYEIWDTYTHILPFFDPKMSASLTIKNIRRIEWEHFSEVGAEFDFEKVPSDEHDIEKFVRDLNREITNEILSKKNIDWE